MADIPTLDDPLANPFPADHLYPSLAKLLLLAFISPLWLFDIILYYAIERFIPHPVAVLIACSPTLLVLGRWLIHRPALSLTAQGLTLCNFSYRNQFFPWESITGINRYVINSRGVNQVFLRITTQDGKTFWNGFQGGARIAELLLPTPVTAAMLRIAEAYAVTERHNMPQFTPSIADLQSIEKKFQHPWTWSCVTVVWGLRYGVPIGLIAGVALVVTLPYIPSYGSPPLFAGILVGAIAIIVVFIWPCVTGYWFTRRAWGNKVPALVASMSANVCIYICLAVIGGHGDSSYAGIAIVTLPVVLAMMWFASRASGMGPGALDAWFPPSRIRRQKLRRSR